MHVLFKIKQRAIYLLCPRRPGVDEALSSLARVSFRFQPSGIEINHIEDHRQPFRNRDFIRFDSAQALACDLAFTRLSIYFNLGVMDGASRHAGSVARPTSRA